MFRLIRTALDVALDTASTSTRVSVTSPKNRSWVSYQTRNHWGRARELFRDPSVTLPLGRAGDSAKLDLALRQNHPDSIPAFSRRRLFKLGDVVECLGESVQEVEPNLWVLLLPPPEDQGYENLVPFLEELLRASEFHLEIVILGLGTEFHFFPTVYVLLAPFLPLRRVVLVLTEVHDLARRWFRIRIQLDEIEISVGR